MLEGKPVPINIAFLISFNVLFFFVQFHFLDVLYSTDVAILSTSTAVSNVNPLEFDYRRWTLISFWQYALLLLRLQFNQHEHEPFEYNYNQIDSKEIQR